jgi:hypothetical protein
MRTYLLILLSLLAFAAWGDDKKPSPPAPPPVKMSDISSWHGQAIEAKFSALQAQFNQLQSAAQALAKERDDLRASVCKDAKVELAVCTPDYSAGVVRVESKPAEAK